MNSVVQVDSPLKLPVNDYPAVQLVDLVITGAVKSGNIYVNAAHTRLKFKSRLQNVIQHPDMGQLVISFPDSQLPCPVLEVADGKIIKPIYFLASIYNTPAQNPGDPTVVWMELELELDPGNYLLAPEHINKSLAGSNHPFRLGFEPVDIVVYKALA